VEQGYPPEAVLLELYMSGDLSYTMAKIAEMGLVEQSHLHSTTSQYGSMSRGMRFILPQLRERIQQGLEGIRIGQLAEEWQAEQAAGCPTLEMLRDSARSLPLYRLEQQLRHRLRGEPIPQEFFEVPQAPAAPAVSDARAEPEDTAGWRGASAASGGLLSGLLGDAGLDFYMRLADGLVETGLGVPVQPAGVRLETTADVLDGMLSGRLNAMRAAMTGKLQFKGEAKVAMSQQQVQADLVRLYSQARSEVVGTGA
jgi:hypothetical protein